MIDQLTIDLMFTVEPIEVGITYGSNDNNFIPLALNSRLECCGTDYMTAFACRTTGPTM